MSKSGKKAKSMALPQQICPICMTKPTNSKTVECQHQFCYRCLSKWGRRKGNCPLCRARVRKIHYKKAIIEPEYLKYFDDDSSIIFPNHSLNFEIRLPEPAPPEPQPPRPTPPPTPRTFFFIPMFSMMPSLPETGFFNSFPFVMFPHNNA